MGESVSSIRRRLVQLLRGSLPGGRAHRLMAPVPRPGWTPGRQPPGGRPAAVLLLIYPLDTLSPAGTGDVPGPAGLVFTERTDTVESHRRQICFPGGVLEEGEDPESAALREAEEETALSPEIPHIIGRLSPLWIPASGYTVTPVVATAGQRPRFEPSPREVERILEVPLADFLRPGAVHEQERTADGRWTQIRFFEVSGSWLWGATAMILAELLTLLGWPGPAGATGPERNWDRS